MRYRLFGARRLRLSYQGVARLLACAAGASLLHVTAALAQHGALGGEWREYSGDLGATKYSPLDQIDRSNVAGLSIAWRRPALDAAVLARSPRLRAASSFRSTPLMVGGVLYASNGVGFVEAFDAGTGETLWVEPPLDDGPTGYRGASTRGVGYWQSGNDTRILTQHSEYLLALDAKTGRPIPTFGDNGRVNVSADIGANFTYTWTGAPFVIGDLVVLGGTPGDEFANKEATRSDVRAYDVRTGKLRWVFHVIPQAGEPGVETWENDSWRYTGHAPVWSLMSADPELGLLYLPITSSTSDMYGGHRLGDNLYSQSVVAVEAATGKRVWHYQTVHHDLWDYDPPAAPILMDITVDGRPIKALVQITKQSYAYVLDRTTGKPVWPIDERAVPQSTVPGERTSPTQPIPTKPPPFDLQGATEENLIDFTPQLRAEAVEILKRYTHGPLFTPPSIRDDRPGGNLGTIELPGSGGGPNWTGGAVDPDTGILYVPSATAPFVADVEPGDASVTNLRYVKGTRLWGPAGPRGLPLFKPPYGRITALDMNRGEILWQVANGDGPRDNPAIKDLNLGPLGNPGHAAPLVTKTLLFAGEGSDTMVVAGRIPPDMPFDTAAGYGEPWFRAFDKATGEVLAEIALPAGTTGAPMTYLHRGKQYIVVAVGGRDAPPEWVALSLPTAQAAAATPEQLVAEAKRAAGLDHPGTFLRICVAPDNSNAARRPAPPAAGPRAVPDRATSYAAPYRVFDDLYFVGTRIHSAWALTTRDGIVVIDTLFDYASEPEIVDGLTALGLDPRNIKYVLISHAHGDHDQGAALLQSRYGAKVVMGAADWDATLARPATAAGGVPKRDIAVGAEGTKIALGGTTIDVIATPGHTRGTLSYVFPVHDKGRTLTVAYSGGTAFNFPREAQNFAIYRDSQKKIGEAARAAGATVLMTNHSEFDRAYDRARLAQLPRAAGEKHPYETDAATVQRYFEMGSLCAEAQRLSMQSAN